jgi:hypothetical protein
MKKQLLHRVIKLSKLLARQKRKTRRTIELLKKKNAALVRENTQGVKTMQGENDVLVRKNVSRCFRIMEAKVKTHAAQVAALVEEQDALVRENTQRIKTMQKQNEDLVRKNKEILGDLQEKKIWSQVLLERKAVLVEEHAAQLAALVEEHAAQLAGVSRDRDAALAALNRLRVEVRLDESELLAVRVEIDAALKRLKSAQIRCNAEQAVAKNNRMYCCPITLGLMHNPVFTSNGITYERVAIEKWLATQVIENKPLVCPHRNPLVSTQLTPNLLVKNLITEAVDKEVARLSKTIRHPLG